MLLMKERIPIGSREDIGIKTVDESPMSSSSIFAWMLVLKSSVSYGSCR